MNISTMHQIYNLPLLHTYSIITYCLIISGPAEPVWEAVLPQDRPTHSHPATLQGREDTRDRASLQVS